MGNKTNIRLIDSHAESDGGNHNNVFFGQKTVLIMTAQVCP